LPEISLQNALIVPTCERVGVLTPTKLKGGMKMQQTRYGEILLFSQLASGHEESWHKLWESPLVKKLRRNYYQKYGYDGEDLFQNVMTEFYQAAGRYVKKGKTDLPVYGVLETIAHRIEANFIAKKKRRSRIATLIPWEFSDDDGNEFNIEALYAKNNELGVKWEEELLEQDETRTMLLRIFEKVDNKVITTEQYELLKMSYIENKSDKVIAQELGENVNTIKSRRQRAQHKLRKSFKNQQVG